MPIVTLQAPRRALDAFSRPGGSPVAKAASPREAARLARLASERVRASLRGPPPPDDLPRPEIKRPGGASDDLDDLDDLLPPPVGKPPPMLPSHAEQREARLAASRAAALERRGSKS